jgi:hypothetical protein
MKRTISVTWTITDSITIDIPDGELTCDEINERAEFAVNAFIPMSREEYDWEWHYGDEPKAREADTTPPEEAWFLVNGVKIAINGVALVTKDCPFDGFINIKTWKTDLTSKGIERLSLMLRDDIKELPLHKGWFHRSFRCFKGFKVVGIAPEPGRSSMEVGGYVLGPAGELLAILMPHASIPSQEDLDSGEYFQFNPTEKLGHG